MHEVRLQLGAEDVEPLTWFLADHGRRVSGVGFMNALNEMQRICRDVAQWWETFDLLLTPTLGEPPVQLGVLADADDPMRGFARAAVVAASKASGSA